MQEQGRHGFWWTSTKQWVQKQYFNMAHNINLEINDNKSNQICILGHQFNSNEQAKIVYSSLLWFTYREGLHFQGTSITSDVGWGCMLRVGQMAMAQALRRTKGLQYYGDSDTVGNIIRMFVDSQQRFSVESMVRVGEQFFRKPAGSWFTPSQTAHILKEIQNKDQKSPLRVLICNNEFEISSAIQYLSCQNHDKQRDVSQRELKKNKTKISYDPSISIFPGMIIILIRIGMDTPQPDMLKSVLAIMKINSFMGILGGKPGLAHYIVGLTETSFIYLDPHCVKEKQRAEEFFNESMFSMPHERVDSSMGLCFYVGDYGQLVRLYDDLGVLKNDAFYSYELVPPPQLVEVLPVDHYQLLGAQEQLPPCPRK